MPLDYVFVYGSLKRGFRNHHVMAGTRFLGSGVTKSHFTMLDLGRYPGVMRGIDTVAGEVFEVASHLMGRLDRLEDNGRVYQREMTSITMATGSVEAWIYIYLLVRGGGRTVKPRGGIVTWRETPALQC